MESIGLPILLTTAGAIIMKLLDSFVGRPARRVEEAARIRAELRGDLVALRTEFAALRESEQHWREAHFNEMSELARLRDVVREYEGRMAEMAASNFVLMNRVSDLERRLGR